MPEQRHCDPTFDAACRMEINEKGCSICQRRIFIDNNLHCSMSKKFPFCKKDSNGFMLDLSGE